jgi:hypothetical protein
MKRYYPGPIKVALGADIGAATAAAVGAMVGTIARRVPILENLSVAQPALFDAALAAAVYSVLNNPQQEQMPQLASQLDLRMNGEAWPVNRLM